jgi:hypothetical protein
MGDCYFSPKHIYMPSQQLQGQGLVSIGILNQGYPLLQYEDAVPVRRPLSARWKAPDPTTWAAQGTPRGGKGWCVPGCTSWTEPPQGSTGPLYAQPGPSITVRGSQASMTGPLGGIQIPPSKVWATTRSRDRGYPSMSMGPVLTRVRPYPVRLRSPLRWRPAAATWLVARDISQRAEPDVRPLKPRGLCIYCWEDVPPAHPADGWCAPSAFNAFCPLHWQVAQGHPADGAPIQSIVKQWRAARRTVVIIPYTRSFPCTPIRRRSRMSGHKKIAPAANIGSSNCYICYVPGPTCRGSVPLYMPP